MVFLSSTAADAFYCHLGNNLYLMQFLEQVPAGQLLSVANTFINGALRRDDIVVSCNFMMSAKSILMPTKGWRTYTGHANVYSLLISSAAEEKNTNARQEINTFTKQQQ